jgi:hypothetical protein
MKHIVKIARGLLAGFVVLLAFGLANGGARAADRDRIEAFLNITGFDVALESIRLSAGSAPQIIGMDPTVFGSDWTRVTDEVFETKLMHGIALDILEQTLSTELLNHGARFYASELGQRLVQAENTGHMMEDDAAKKDAGSAIVAQLVETGSPRLELLKRMNAAIDVSGSSVRALQEIQLRFLLAANAAGIIELRMDTDALQDMLKAQEGQMHRAVRQSALIGAAYTYRDFSDADVEAYAQALEQQEMKDLYSLMNAVQYEVMANRFEVLAGRMAGLHPGQDI